MKQPILILFTFFFLNFLTAQNSKFGVIGGFNYSDVRGDIIDLDELDFFLVDSEYRLSFHIGLFADFSISNKILFEPQIRYSSQGYIHKFIFDGFNDPIIDREVKTSVRLNYLTIPLLLKIKLVEKFSVNAGPEIGFLLNKSFVSKNDSSIDGINKGDRTNNIGDFELDYGIRLGVSYYINKDLFFQLGYYHGFSDIKNDKYLIGDVKKNNSVFNLSVGYMLF